MVKLRLFYDMICIFLVHNALEGCIYFIISTKILHYIRLFSIFCLDLHVFFCPFPTMIMLKCHLELYYLALLL